MKKRVLTLILAVILCVSTVLTLTSCGEHTFKTDWSKDATHHWHACEDADCTEVSDKAEHTWDNGKETTYATETEEGVMTYTCTVCKHTKTAPTTFDGVNISQYGEAVYETTLQNLTVDITLKSDNQTAHSVLKLNADEYSHAGTGYDGAVNSSGENSDTAATLRNEYLFFKDVLYKDITYDAANKIYTTSADYTLTVTDDEEGTEIVYKSIKMTISGNRVTSVEAEFELKQDGTTVATGTIELELTDYNTTEVVIAPGSGDGDGDEGGGDPIGGGDEGGDTITGDGGDGDEGGDEGGNGGGNEGGPDGEFDV